MFLFEARYNYSFNREERLIVHPLFYVYFDKKIDVCQSKIEEN